MLHYRDGVSSWKAKEKPFRSLYAIKCLDQIFTFKRSSWLLQGRNCKWIKLKARDLLMRLLQEAIWKIKNWHRTRIGVGESQEDWMERAQPTGCTKRGSSRISSWVLARKRGCEEGKTWLWQKGENQLDLGQAPCAAPVLATGFTHAWNSGQFEIYEAQRWC